LVETSRAHINDKMHSEIVSVLNNRRHRRWHLLR